LTLELPLNIKILNYNFSGILFLVVVVVYLISTLTPLQVEEIFLRQLFHQCISHESNVWRKRCVFRPDLKTGKEQGARRWSGIVFQSLGAAALNAAAADEEVTVI